MSYPYLYIQVKRRPHGVLGERSHVVEYVRYAGPADKRGRHVPTEEVRIHTKSLASFPRVVEDLRTVCDEQLALGNIAVWYWRK